MLASATLLRHFVHPRQRMSIMRKRIAMLVALLALGLASFTGAKVAWAGANGGNVYDDGGQCVWNWTHMSAGYNFTETRSLTETPWWYWPPQRCTWSNPKPWGYLASFWEYYQWIPGYGWAVCGNQGFEYGGGDTLNMGRPVTGCGSGWYHMWGSSWVYNGGWRYGWVLINTEWLNF